MARQGLYKGFSSFEFDAIKNFQQFDVDAVKMDILNHIYTRQGERVMMPTFGSIIPEMTFEPIDETTMSIVEEELIRIVEYDPRVNLLDIQVIPLYDRNAIIATMVLRYVELDLVENLELNIQFEG